MALLKSVPIFYHVPRCGGTFVLSVIFSFMRAFRRKNMDLFGGREKLLSSPNESIKTISFVTDSGYILFKFVVADPEGLLSREPFSENFVKPSGCSSELECNVSLLGEGIVDIFDILFVIVTSRGFSLRDLLLENMNRLSIFYVEYICLRRIFDRIKSEFKYLKSDRSSHELTHGSITENELGEYLLSDLFPDNWLTRAFCSKLDYLDKIQNEDFLKASSVISAMQRFNFDSGGTQLLLSEIASNHFEIKDFDPETSTYVDKQYFHKNESPNQSGQEVFKANKKIKSVFLEKTIYDRMLYRKFFRK
jgi:hypothetical protein